MGAREMGCQLETVVRAQRRACLPMRHVRASVQLGLQRGAPSLAWSGCVTLWASSQSRPACVWQGTFGLIHSGLARDGPGRPRLFAPRVRRKWLQPGGSQILTMTDGPRALLGYCQGLGYWCPSGCAEMELWAVAGRWVLCRIWHFRGISASDPCL